MDEENVNDEPQLRCSFCNKWRKDVKKLIAGPKCYICDECVAICVDILQEEGIMATAGTRAAERTADRAEEHLKIAQMLLEDGELRAAARDARAAALEALRGVLAIGGTPSAENWADGKVFSTAMTTLPEVARALHEKDTAHVILRMSLAGAELRREDVEQALSAARELTEMLRAKTSE